MLVLGTLNRFLLNHSEPEFTENSLIHHVHFVLFYLPISVTHLKQFQLETKNKCILQTMITYAIHECSEKHLILSDLHGYFIRCSDITFYGGIFLKNEWIIVPTTFQAEMKSCIHQRHVGIESCKKCLRQSLFCSLMKSEIEGMVKGTLMQI